MNMENIENQRSAANIHAGISSQVFAASLVLIVVLLGYLDIKELSFSSLKGILIIVSVFLLLISLITAGIGLKKIRINGQKGNWSLESLHIFFRLQTLFNVIPIILFFIILFVPEKGNKKEKYQMETIELSKLKLKYDSLIYVQLKMINEISKINNSRMDSLIFYKKQNREKNKKKDKI
jgi:hypothetical protein